MLNKDDELAAAAAVDVDDDDDEEAVVVDEEAAFRPASRRPFDCSDDDTSGFFKNWFILNYYITCSNV